VAQRKQRQRKRQRKQILPLSNPRDLVSRDLDRDDASNDGEGLEQVGNAVKVHILQWSEEMLR